ncbi:hypothetical protein NDA13_003546 [Ustilago tritici]|nr:hypothetical protein NDA13_003546 [Ustilago tritici]
MAEEAIKAGNNKEGERILKSILSNQSSSADDAFLKEQEASLLRLGELYRDTKDANALAETVCSSRTFMSNIAKAKTAKLVRTLIDYFEDIPGSRQTQIQNLETKLIGLYYDNKNYREALPLIDALLKELKRLDDKMILTEVHLLESKVNYAISNMPKAKAVLTSARTAANSIYCPPTLQAQLDLQARVLHAEDKDYTSAYSYFFETLEGFALQDDPRAPLALKYQLLCKVMLNLSDDVNSIISGKHATKYAGRDVDAMKAVVQAHEERSLEAFELALRNYKEELSNDPIVRAHLSALYDILLEQNLLRVIEPYSRVEIAHIAKEVKQPVREVETKLSQLILDRRLHGILSQGEGCLVVYDQPVEDKSYQLTLDNFEACWYCGG